MRFTGSEMWFSWSLNNCPKWGSTDLSWGSSCDELLGIAEKDLVDPDLIHGILV